MDVLSIVAAVEVLGRYISRASAGRGGYEAERGRRTWCSTCVVQLYVEKRSNTRITDADGGLATLARQSTRGTVLQHHVVPTMFPLCLAGKVGFQPGCAGAHGRGTDKHGAMRGRVAQFLKIVIHGTHAMWKVRSWCPTYRIWR